MIMSRYTVDISVGRNKHRNGDMKGNTNRKHV